MTTTAARPNLPAYLALFFGLLTLGFSAIFVRLADAPGTVTSFYRMAIGALLMALPFLGQVRQRKRKMTAAGVRWALLGGVLFGLDLVFWSTGIVMSGATAPTLMANTAPLWVGLGSWLLFRERQKGLFWFGLLLAMGGAAVVLGQDLSRATEFGLGTFMGLLAAIFYGGYYLASQRGRAYLSTLAYFWITTTSSALVLLVVNLLFGLRFTGYAQETYLTFLALGLLVQVFGWLVINFAQGYLPATLVAPTLLGQPLVTALLAPLLLGETFTRWQILGGIAVLAGVYLVHRSRG